MLEEERIFGQYIKLHIEHLTLTQYCCTEHQFSLLFSFHISKPEINEGAY